MNKENLIDKLTELGYKAQMINEIPYILGVDIESAKEIMNAIDYKGTWAVRTGNDSVSIDVINEKEE